MFVVIEGPDGAGKTVTQKKVALFLREMGYRVTEVREPGGDAFGEDVRDLIMEYDGILPLTQLLLFSASRNELINTLNMGARPREIFLFDRYVLSSYVYQYDAFYQNRTLTEMLFEHTFPTPDLSFILNASIHTLLTRTAEKRETNHFDVVNPDDITVLETRRSEYLSAG